MNPISAEDRRSETVTCPFCHAPPGNPCTGWKANYGGGSKREGGEPRLRGPHPERIAVIRADPFTMTPLEIRTTLAGIADSLEKAPAHGPARSNIVRRIRTLTGRIT